MLDVQFKAEIKEIDWRSCEWYKEGSLLMTRRGNIIITTDRGAAYLKSGLSVEDKMPARLLDEFESVVLRNKG